MSAALVPLRQLSGVEPFIVTPAGASSLWCSVMRLKRCELWQLPDGDCSDLSSPISWLPFARRIALFWPVDIPSAVSMTAIVLGITPSEPPHAPMCAIYWGWGVPWSRETGDAAPIIEKIWTHPRPVMARHSRRVAA